MNFKLLSLLVLCAASFQVSAQIFHLKIDPTYGGVADPTFRAFIDSQILTIENDINKDLPNAPPKRLMEGMANSSVMAGKGIGNDYASGMEVFLIGGGVGVGADLEKDKNTKSSISGVGVAPGVIVGMNLGFMDTSKILGMDTNRLNLYMNFMNYNYNKVLSTKVGEESDVKLGMQSMGVHFRYDWIQGNNSKWLGWGGVKFHFGYEYNKTDITFNSTINKTVNQTSSGGETITGNISGRPVATINSATHSIPLELSTDIRLLYILSIYTGVGADYNMGSAKGKGALNSTPSNVTCTGGNCGGGATIGVTPEANINATGKVNPFLYRGFAGVQINLPFIRIFGQVDKALGNDLIGATVGVRFVY